MARNSPTKGFGPKSDWGGWGSKQAFENAIRSGQVKTDTMAAGNLRSTLIAAATRLAAPIRNTARNVGYWAAESADEAARFIPKTGRVVRTKGDVFTPEGVFKGKDVFIKKPDLTPKQIASVQKGLDTKAARVAAAQVRTGSRAAIAAGTAGTIVGAAGATEGVRVVKQNIGTVKKVVKKARGGGRNKK